MSGDGVQGLAPLGRGEELDFGRNDPGVVPAQAAGAAGALPHGVVASHGVALPQGVLVRQLALLERLDQNEGLLIQLSGAAVRRCHLQRQRTLHVFTKMPNN